MIIASHIWNPFKKTGLNTNSKHILLQNLCLPCLQLQELGQPPKDLVGDMGPVMSFDPSGNPVLPDLSSVLGAAGVVPGAGGEGSAPPGQGEQREECCIM